MDGVVVIPGRQPQSVAKAWNDAVRLVGDDLILSNDDITFAPSTIEAMVATARSRPQAGMVSPIEGERFALFYLRYAAWLSMDGFSEDYIAAYFEDDHAARMLRLRGWELAIAPSDVGHVGSATISAYNRARKEQHHRDFRANRALYYLTWGGLPGEEVYDEPRKRKA
jgi:GT2 family glycosyltransferase